ncbi:MAG: 4Fe-4S ferredoxin [Nitrospirae bacterium RBG_13_41_22]|nr:MAG: 4Fe-4S ferredoxin [Nitrospirae bacterium RBG_13_41_22]
MKSLIIYFSQTGNTRSMAKCIHDGIMKVTSQCDIKALNEVDIRNLSDYDLVGIGSPVFYLKEPFNVRDFIESLPELNGQHWFIFCTHGNIVGNFFPLTAERLKKKGGIVIGFHHTYANITVPFYPRPSYTSGHPDSHDLEQAKQFGREIAERSVAIKNQNSIPVTPPYPVSSEEWVKESNIFTEELLKQRLPKLSINIDTCIQCHECEENCPVQGIDVQDNPPRIQKPCIFCWRCVTICPTLSIGANWEPLVRMAPANYARYKKELDKAAARGEFRWLVKPESIILDDPLYKKREREVSTKSRDE